MSFNTHRHHSVRKQARKSKIMCYFDCMQIYNLSCAFSIIKSQLVEMSTRLDHLESSLRKDIHSILDLLHQQQQVQLHMQHHQHLSQQNLAARLVCRVISFRRRIKTNVYRPATSYQPSEHSDFSFDNLSTTTDNNTKQPLSLPPPAQLQQLQARNVQRSISQPECAVANEKSLFK